MTLKGNTFTVDNRKSPLFLYSAGTINQRTQNVPSWKETLAQFVSTTWPSLSWNSTEVKGFQGSFKLPHFIAPCVCQLVVFFFFSFLMLARLLVVTFALAKGRGICPQQYWCSPPEPYSTALNGAFGEAQIISQLSFISNQRIKHVMSIPWRQKSEATALTVCCRETDKRPAGQRGMEHEHMGAGSMSPPTTTLLNLSGLCPQPEYGA